MKCPFCSHDDTKVVDKREIEDAKATRRRRECLKCKKRFTTYERIETSSIIIVKKDGRREPYDRQKLRNGMIKACEKRSVSLEKIDKELDDIEAILREYPKKEIPSNVIGELVMKKLKKLDKVAYIRFASVYRDFADLESFQKEVSKLIKK